MTDFAILVGLANKEGVGLAQQSDRNHRLGQIYLKIFSLGQAWHGNQGTILLRTSASQGDICEMLSPLAGDDDLVVVLEISVHSALSIGWNSDEEGLDNLYDVAKIDASARG